MGKFISQNTRNARWGSGALKSISSQLQQEMPGLTGFSEANMRKMRLFYEAWQPVFEPQAESTFDMVPVIDHIELIDFRSQVANELSDAKRSQPANELGEELLRCFLVVGFDNHIRIISNVQTFDEQIFYVERCAREFWGREGLKNALRNNLYHQQGSMPSNFALTIPDEKQRQVAMQTFKEDNVLDFLVIENPDLVDEHNVEEQIVKNVKNFMMSFGGEFAFMGEQYRIIVNGKERKLDLLFYHRRMRCLVAIELKGGEFMPEYAGKLNYYLSALDSLVKLPEENPSIGILLCRDKDNTEVEFTLRDMTKPMGVATYHSSNELPEQYRKALPSVEDLKRLM
ncbi:MAG: DUF1016 family protein [Paludibacteraceae bacterium]|nr:DUF1016 family protein [Paludibacteraceae bacterium]